MDALGNPSSSHLTPGQASDLKEANVLLEDIGAQIIIAGKGDDAQQRVIEPLLAAGKAVVIPRIRTRSVQREYDQHLYNLIDDFFGHLKRYRAISTRCDKTATAFPGVIRLAMAIVWLV